MTKTNKPTVHKDSWKQVLEVNDFVLFGTSQKSVVMGQIVRVSDGGTWWVRALPKPGQKLAPAARWLRSERTYTQKIEVDEIVMASLVVSDSFITPPVIRVTLE